MVRSLLSRLLDRRSGQRGQWNRHDPFVMRSRDQEFQQVGPFELKLHPRCNMTQESFDQLGVLANDAGYRCARDKEENHISHFRGGNQHKFDGLYVLFGLQHGNLWDRALCHYDPDKPHELLIIEYYEAGALSFLTYTRFLDVLERHWAHIEQLYGIRFGTIPAEIVALMN